METNRLLLVFAQVQLSINSVIFQIWKAFEKFYDELTSELLRFCISLDCSKNFFESRFGLETGNVWKLFQKRSSEL